MTPVLRFLFPGIPKGHPALESISANMIANMLGLGWAATPAGLQAMEELEGLEEERRRGRKKFVPQGLQAMKCVHFDYQHIIAAAYSINMIAYRAQYGSINPTAGVGPALVATVSTIVAAIYCKWKTESGADGSAF